MPRAVRHLSDVRRTDVRCGAGLFLGHENQIARLTEMVNHSAVIAERASGVRGIALTTDALLACEHYNKESADCRLCRSFSALRRSEAAQLAHAEAYSDRLGKKGNL